MSIHLFSRGEIICLLVMGFVLFLSRMYTEEYQYRSFYMIWWAGFIHVLFDLITVYLVNRTELFSYYVINATHVIFFISGIVFTLEVSRYVISCVYVRMADAGVRRKINYFYGILSIILALGFSLIPIDIAVGNTTNYSSGIPVYITFGIIFVLIAFNLVFIIMKYKQMEKQQIYSLVTVFVVELVLLLIECIDREYLISGGAITIATVGVYFSLENPKVLRNKNRALEVSRKELQSMLIRERRYNAFHDAITKSNICEFYIDLDANTFYSFKNDSAIFANNDSNNWDNLVENYVEHYVYEEYRNQVRQIMNRDYLKNHFTDKIREIHLDSRVRIKGTDRWFSNTLILSDTYHDGRPYHVIAFLRDITSSKNVEAQSFRQIKIMEVLSLDYDSVLDVSLRDNTLIMVRESENLRNAGVMQGLAYDEVVMRVAANLISKDDVENYLNIMSSENISKRIRSEGNFSFRFSINPNKQGQKYFESRVVLMDDMYDGENILIGTRCVDHVVKNEIESRKADSLMIETFANAIPGGFKISNDDHEFSIRYVSDRMANMIGYTPDELMEVTGGSLLSIIHPDDLVSALYQMVLGYNSSDQYSSKYRIKCKDGSYKWIQDNGRKILNSDGTMEHYSVLWDIDDSEKKAIQLQETHEELDRERRQYKYAIRNNALYCFEYDVTDGMIRKPIDLISSDSTFKNLQLNYPILYDDFCKIVNEYSGLSILDKSMESVFTTKGIQDIFAKGETNVEVEMYLSKTRQYRKANTLLYQDDKNQHIYAFVYVTDITEMRIRAEQEREMLRAAYISAERANAAKTEFLSRISHDLRTPINAIIGMTNISYANLENPDKIKDCIDKISYASNHLSDMVNEILDMRQIETGKIELKQEKIHLKEMLKNTVDMVSAQADLRKQTLNFTVNRIIHNEVIGDTLRLQQIIINLLGNAIKYTHDSGEISLSVLEKASVGAGIGNYELVVEDNGIGMTQEYIAHIFEPFTRAKDDYVSRQQGAGLGMAIVNGLVHAMDGEIAIESEVGKGTKITLSLLLEFDEDRIQRETVDSEHAKERNSSDSDEWKDKRILLVDDNELNREIILELIGMLGPQIDTAEDGKDAYEKVKASKEGYYDLVLMDVMMPVMNGYDSAKAIRALDRMDTKKMPIVALTANAFAEDIRKAYDNGMNAHLSKPINMEKVFEVLREYLG